MSLAIVDNVRSQQPDGAMVVLVVVPEKEYLIETACILNAAEALREIGAILRVLSYTSILRSSCSLWRKKMPLSPER